MEFVGAVDAETATLGKEVSSHWGWPQTPCRGGGDGDIEGGGLGRVFRLGWERAVSVGVGVDWSFKPEFEW